MEAGIPPSGARVETGEALALKRQTRDQLLNQLRTLREEVDQQEAELRRLQQEDHAAEDAQSANELV